MKKSFYLLSYFLVFSLIGFMLFIGWSANAFDEASYLASLFGVILFAIFQSIFNGQTKAKYNPDIRYDIETLDDLSTFEDDKPQLSIFTKIIGVLLVLGCIVVLGISLMLAYSILANFMFRGQHILNDNDGFKFILVVAYALVAAVLSTTTILHNVRMLKYFSS